MKVNRLDLITDNGSPIYDPLTEDEMFCAGWQIRHLVLHQDENIRMSSCCLSCPKNNKNHDCSLAEPAMFKLLNAAGGISQDVLDKLPIIDEWLPFGFAEVFKKSIDKGSYFVYNIYVCF